MRCKSCLGHGGKLFLVIDLCGRADRGSGVGDVPIADPQRGLGIGLRIRGSQRNCDAMRLEPRRNDAGRRLQGDSVARKRGRSGIDHQRAPTSSPWAPKRARANRGTHSEKGIEAPALGARGAQGQRTRDCEADNPKSIRNPQSPIRNQNGPLAAAGFDPTRPRGPQKDT